MVATKRCCFCGKAARSNAPKTKLLYSLDGLKEASARAIGAWKCGATPGSGWKYCRGCERDSVIAAAIARYSALVRCSTRSLGISEGKIAQDVKQWVDKRSKGRAAVVAVATTPERPTQMPPVAPTMRSGQTLLPPTAKKETFLNIIKGAIRTSDPTAATEKFRELAQMLKDAEAKLDKLTKELKISSELSEFAGVLELPKSAKKRTIEMRKLEEIARAR